MELLIFKTDINAKDSWGHTLLHYAALHNSFKVVELLISKGANINVKDNQGQTPLAIVRNCKQTKMEKFLLKKGATE